MPTDLLVAITNLGLITVTGLLIWASVRDSHHHEEHMGDIQDEENERLITLIDKTLEREHAHKDAAQK